MAVKKLSQITAAGSPPAPTDQLVGVTGGTTDNLFSLTQIGKGAPLSIGTTPITSGTDGKFLVDVGGILNEADAHFPEAPSDLAWYVATTGSDSNPGTIGSPFASIQRALTEAARFNWVFQYKPFIFIADGTYPMSPASVIEIGTFVNLFLPIFFIGNAANPQNIVLADGWALQFSDGSIVIGGFSFSGVVIGSCINCIDGVISVADPVIFNDNDQTPFYNEAFSFTFCNTTLTVNATHLQWFSFNGPGVTWFSRPTVNLPVALTVTAAFFECDGVRGNNGIGVASIIWGGPTVSNAGGVTGKQLRTSGFGFTQTQNGDIADIPGTGGVQLFDSTPVIAGFGGQFGTFYQSKSGLPTTSDIPTSGTWRIMKDTSGGSVYLAANDGGSIVKVALV